MNSLTMDPSNRLKFLLGECKIPVRTTPKVPESEIKPEEWVILINKIIQNLKPQIKYLSPFKPIGDEFNYTTNNTQVITDDAKIIFPKSITSKTRCILLALLSSKKEGELIPGGLVHQFSIERSLYLTNKGEIILQDCKYESKRNYDFTSKVVIDWECQYCIFKRIDDSELRKLLEEFKWIRRRIIRNLYDVVQDDVKQRKSRLKTIEDIGNSIKTIIDRID